MSKRIFRVMAALIAMAALALTGCSGDNADDPDTYKIGITQYTSHPSLDSARDGFKKALEDNGIKVSYDEQNAQADQATITSIANKFKSDKPDLILAIATPSAQTTSGLITDIPILFTAVTDPVSAQLVDSNENPGGNVTGTNDMNPVAEQIALFKRIDPNIETIGIVYSSGEINSQIQVDLAKKAAEAEGMKVVEKAITNTSELSQAAAALDVDAIYVPTDNNVVAGIDTMVQRAEDVKIPMVCGESDSVEKGCLATYSIDYYQLGYQTGEMAVKILKDGAKPADMPVESQKQFTLVINKGAAERIGLTLPEDLLAEAEVVG